MTWLYADLMFAFLPPKYKNCSNVYKSALLFIYNFPWKWISI